jgi:hypothetical protein
MYLQYLPKQGGGRLKNVMSFRATCDSADKTVATAWLEATGALKGPEEAAYDQFVHVTKGLMKEQDVVIKLQGVSRLSEKEAQLAIRFRDNLPPNVVVPICEFNVQAHVSRVDRWDGHAALSGNVDASSDHLRRTLRTLSAQGPVGRLRRPIGQRRAFKCKNDLINWKQPVTQPKQFCSGKTDLTSVFVMEHIPHNLIEYAISHPTPKAPILKQIGFALLNLQVQWGLTHGDIASGNIMLDIGDPKTITYTIGGPIHVDTQGYEVVFIDFQRSVQTRELGAVLDEICLAYELLWRWAKWPIRDLMDRIEATTSIPELITILQSIH